MPSGPSDNAAVPDNSSKTYNARGYQGAYDSVQRFVRDYKQQPAKVAAFVPLTFAAGEAYQFDWSEEEVEIGGVGATGQGCPFSPHPQPPALRYGVSPRNPGDAVCSPRCGLSLLGRRATTGHLRQPQNLCRPGARGQRAQFQSPLPGADEPLRDRAGSLHPSLRLEKGQVEKQVQDVRRRCFTPRRKVDSLAELNRRLLTELVQAAQTRPHPDDPSQTVWQRFEQERTTLRPLAARFNGYVERELRVDSTCLIHFDRNTYSVDSRYAHRHVTARVFADRLQVYAQSELIAEHPRLFGRDKTQFDPWHYLELLEHKPGALRHGAPFKEWVLPPALSRCSSNC